MWRTIGKLGFIVKARTLPKTLTIAGLIVALIVAMFVCPWQLEIEADGELQPVHKRDVFVDVPGTITKVVLEDRGYVNRHRDGLPSYDHLAGRIATGEGLSRPELALLGAVAKMDVTRRFLKLPAESTPNLDGILAGYFPAAIGDMFGELFSEHLLAREID